MIAHTWSQLAVMGGLLLVWVIRANRPDDSHAPTSAAAKQENLP